MLNLRRESTASTSAAGTSGCAAPLTRAPSTSLLSRLDQWSLMPVIDGAKCQCQCWLQWSGKTKIRAPSTSLPSRLDANQWWLLVSMMVAERVYIFPSGLMSFSCDTIYISFMPQDYQLNNIFATGLSTQWYFCHRIINSIIFLPQDYRLNKRSALASLGVPGAYAGSQWSLASFTVPQVWKSFFSQV